jgi:DNA-binding transcriptional regulator YdaS (Cro superfamily)
MAAVLTGMDLLRSPACRGVRTLIARELGIEKGAISQWKVIPAERVPPISRITGIPRHLLRPDLWDPPCGCGQQEPAEAAG